MSDPGDTYRLRHRPRGFYPLGHAQQRPEGGFNFLTHTVSSTYGIADGAAHAIASGALQRFGDINGHIRPDQKARADQFIRSASLQVYHLRQEGALKATAPTKIHWKYLYPLWEKPNGLCEIHTGGTIAMGLRHGLREMVPGVLEVFTRQVGLEETRLFGLKDSSQILLSEIPQIASRAIEIVDLGGTPLITHGTDTLETTAFMLSQICPTEFMVLTGAFHPFGSGLSDAFGNFKAARHLTLFSGDPRIPQVPFVVMNDKVYLASSLIKLDTDCHWGRRGFGSYTDPVAYFEGGKCFWNLDFLTHFDPERRSHLSAHRAVLHDHLRAASARNELAIAPTEIIFVNAHTPEAFLASVVQRMRAGATDALVIQGDISSHAAFQSELLNLKALGKPIYCEHSQEFAPPAGLSLNQLGLKLALLTPVADSLEQLEGLLKENLAGEGWRTRPVATESAPLTSDFYRTEGTVRSFLIYNQDFWVFKAALAEEIARLAEARKHNEEVELVIEGLGNGHIDTDRAPSPSPKKDAFKDALSPRAWALFQEHESLVDLLKFAHSVGIRLKMISKVPDAVADQKYKIGADLAEPSIGMETTPFPGRWYLAHVGAVQWT